jgi:hypothetical protein
MYDETEGPRRILIAMLNAGVPEDEAQARVQLIEQYGEDNVWNSDEVSEAFSFEAFMAPFAVVVRKVDGVKGSVQFVHDPRFYFGFKPA